MSALDYISGRGMALVGGDIPNSERKESEEFLKTFGEHVLKIGKELQIPVSKLFIFKLGYIMIARDVLNYHFAFIDNGGTNEIQYIDISSNGVVNSEKLASKINLEIGEVKWMITVLKDDVMRLNIQVIANAANSYVQTVISANKREEYKVETNTVPELVNEISAFEKDYSKSTKTAFIIMQFSKTKAHDAVVETIKNTLKIHNIIGLRADDKEYSDDLFANIRTYMHCCTFGIAIFERILEDDFNPNVSIEVGYMMGLGKKVCLLKDQTLKSLPSDLVGKLYKPFDPQDIDVTLPVQLGKWLKDRGQI